MSCNPVPNTTRYQFDVSKGVGSMYLLSIPTLPGH